MDTEEILSELKAMIEVVDHQFEGIHDYNIETDNNYVDRSNGTLRQIVEIKLTLYTNKKEEE